MLVIIASVYIQMVQAFLPMAALLLVLHIYLVNKDGNIRWLSGVLSFAFGMSMLSNFCWYLLPDYLAPVLGLNGLVNWYYYYYVTGIFWMIGYSAIAYVLLQMMYSRQWYLERRIDRMITAAAAIAICLTGAYVLLNLDWQSKYLIDIFVLLIFLCLDIIVVSTALKMSLSIRGELQYLAMSVMAFFSINAIADLLFETRWLFMLSTLITVNLGRVELSFHIRDLIDINYNISLLIMSCLLFLFVLDPFARRTLDEMRGRLKDTQLFMDDLIAKSPDATCIFGRDGRLVLVNDPFLQIFGLKRNDLDRSFNIFSDIGKKLFNEETYAEILKVRDLDTVIIPKLKIKGIPGGRQETFYLYIKMFPTSGSDGRISNYVMIIEDITVRIEMEMALRQSEEKFRVLAETSPAAIIIYQDESIVYVNPAFEKTIGYTLEDFLTMKPWDFIHPDYRALIEEKVLLRKQGIPLSEHYDAKILTRDGRELWSSNWTTTTTYMNRPAGMIIAIDITDRKQAEEALRESEARYRALIDNSPLGILTCDLEGNITSINPQILEILGSKSPEFTMSVNLLNFEPVIKFSLAEILRDCIITGESRVAEKSYTSHWGKSVYLGLHLTPLRDHAGQIYSVLCVMEDITARKRLEGDLRKAYSSLKEEYERKTDFTNAAAHELRTPLTPIIGYTDILMAEVKDERHRGFLEIIERNALRQKTLVNRMLELASLDAGMAHVNCVELAVRPLVLEIADNYRAVNPNIRVDVPEGLRIDTDPDILRHVLDNLVSNAVKYSDNNKAVEIRVAEAGGSYRFSVKDHGAGIPQEEWGKIFERFYLVGGDSDSRTSGRSGLGLALVKAYISLIGGSVWLESEPGKGSTFFFTVPKAPSASRQSG